jgi:hypothetical protein
MCTADTDLLGLWNVRSLGGPLIGTSTDHKCKDFDAIRQWTMENQIPIDSTDLKWQESDVWLPSIP